MDKRYKFVRGHPFAGLEDYFGSKEIGVKNKKLVYYLKSNTRKKSSDEPPSFKKKLACFYEILMQGIYGGKRNKKFEVKNNQGFSFKVRPDLVLGEKVSDSKATASKNFLRLPDSQMMGYSLLQLAKIRSKIPIIKTEIFRHGIRNLESRFIDKPIEDLIFQLTQKTRYLISMDLSVLFEYYRLSKRYDKGKSHTKITSGALNTLLAYPEESLEQIGIDLKDIEIKKRKFPSDVKIGIKLKESGSKEKKSSSKTKIINYEINSFPVLIIGNKNYPENWLEYFNEIIRDKEKVPEILFDELWGTEEVDYSEDDAWKSGEEAPF